MQLVTVGSLWRSRLVYLKLFCVFILLITLSWL